MQRFPVGHPMTVFACGVLLFVLGAQAAPTITVDRVQQRYPWNNIVDVDYTIAGMTGDPYDYRVELHASGMNDGVEVTVAASNFVDCAWCDLVTSNGSWRVSWNSAADGADFIDANAQVTLKLVYAPVAASEANYMIINLASGSSSANYPARLVRELAPEPSQFNRAIYKTDRLVLKRVHTVTNENGYTFLMKDHNGNNRPVLLTNDFYLGIFPVTQRQYQRVVGSNPSSFKTDDGEDLAAHRPVETMTRGSVRTGFNDKLSFRTTVRGNTVPAFCLPTEAQWEYACRAGTTTDYHWGSDYSKFYDYAWINKNSDARTHAVGGKLPNDWGFYDMQGNTADWTDDIYAAYSTTTDIIVDPRGPGSGTYPLYRGATYKSVWTTVNGYKSGYREFGLADYQGGNYVGFRAAMRIP